MDLFVERIYESNGNFKYYDIAFKTGRLKTVTGIDEIANRIIVGLNTYIGENYRDVTYGVDYFNNVYGHEVSDTVTQDELKAVIINTRGVIAITSFNLTRTAGSRVAKLTSQVQTSLGEIELATEISI
jgi:hypothetical protein